MKTRTAESLAQMKALHNKHVRDLLEQDELEHVEGKEFQLISLGDRLEYYIDLSYGHDAIEYYDPIMFSYIVPMEEETLELLKTKVRDLLHV